MMTSTKALRAAFNLYCSTPAERVTTVVRDRLEPDGNVGRRIHSEYREWLMKRINELSLQGMRNKDIAKEIGISDCTVSNWKRQLEKKKNARNAPDGST